MIDIWAARHGAVLNLALLYWTSLDYTLADNRLVCLSYRGRCYCQYILLVFLRTRVGDGTQASCRTEL